VLKSETIIRENRVMMNRWIIPAVLMPMFVGLFLALLNAVASAHSPIIGERTMLPPEEFDYIYKGPMVTSIEHDSSGTITFRDGGGRTTGTASKPWR
jgi:hypothetical protein